MSKVKNYYWDLAEKESDAIINKYVKDEITKDDAMKKATELVDIIQRKAPKAVAGVIKSVTNFYRGDDEGFRQEIKIFSKLCETYDFKEGVRAFQEKRCPSFKGK